MQNLKKSIGMSVLFLMFLSPMAFGQGPKVLNASSPNECKSSCVEIEFSSGADIIRARDSAGEIAMVEVVDRQSSGMSAKERMLAHEKNLARGERGDLDPMVLDDCDQVSCTEVIDGPGHTTYVTWDSSGDPVHIEIVRHDQEP